MPLWYGQDQFHTYVIQTKNVFQNAQSTTVTRGSQELRILGIFEKKFQNSFPKPFLHTCKLKEQIVIDFLLL